MKSYIISEAQSLYMASNQKLKEKMEYEKTVSLFFSVLGHLHRVFRQKLLRVVPKLDEIP